MRKSSLKCLYWFLISSGIFGMCYVLPIYDLMGWEWGVAALGYQIFSVIVAVIIAVYIQGNQTMKPRIDLLTLLADHMDTVNEKEFDMHHWYEIKSCGTTACAIGHACQLEAFNEAGLSLGNEYDRSWCPVYQEELGYNAVAACLQISYSEAYHLFNSSNYRGLHITPKVVADRIRAFIVGHSTSEAKK